MYRNIIFLTIAIIVISGCSTMSKFQTNDMFPTEVGKVSYHPIQPVAYNDFYRKFDYFKDKEKRTSLDKVLDKEDREGKRIEDKDYNEKLLKYFTNETARIYIDDFKAEGKVSYASMASVSASGSAYQIVVDYLKSRTDSLGDTIYVSGVGLRLRARIVTKKAGLDLSNLYGLGVAASKKQVSGSLEFETIGISGKQITPLVPVPSTLSIESISAAMQALAAIKAKIYGDSREVNIWPQIAGTVGGEPADNLMKLLSATSQPVVETTTHGGGTDSQ